MSIQSKYPFLSREADYGFLSLYYTQDQLHDFEMAIKEYANSDFSEENFEKQSTEGYADVLNWYNGDITTEDLFEMLETQVPPQDQNFFHTEVANYFKAIEGYNNFTHRKYPQRVTEAIRKELHNYCLDEGTGITYDKDGERDVESERIEDFLTPDVIDKTMYLAEERRNGHTINIIDFKEWLDICDVLNAPELSFEDALEINNILYEKYDLRPADIEPITNELTPLREYEITDDIRAEIASYCIKNGVGIQSFGGEFDESVIDDKMLSPELIDKTMYVIEEARKGNDIDYPDVDEWCALVHVLGLSELTYDDSRTICHVLDKYEISPLQIELPHEITSQEEVKPKKTAEVIDR